MKITRYSLYPNGVRPTGQANSGKYVLHSDYLKLEDLVAKFVEVYGEVPIEGSMIEPGRKLWRDYFSTLGVHMILTDEGWEPGDMKQAYIDDGYQDFIYDEVNAPGKAGNRPNDA